MTDKESITRHVRREKAPVTGMEPLPPSEDSVDSVELGADDVRFGMSPDSEAGNRVLVGDGDCSMVV
jgi:hypothetical protein